MLFRRKRGASKSSTVSHFPVESIENSYQHSGVFKGFFVEVEDENSMKGFQENGCFGTKISRTDSEQEIQSYKLHLSKEEAFFLHFCLKCLKILGEDQEILSTQAIFDLFCSQKKNFPSSFVAYQYLRGKKWVVKSGMKFAVDFLLYRESPEVYHSSYMVFFTDDSSGNESEFTGVDLQGLYRVAETCGKELLVLHVKYPEEFENDKNQCLQDKFSKFSVTEVYPRRHNFNP
ncbi:uncharacterized protein LOC129806055 [Phlebotomus papatasi]|uniref:uncharacterized protein LOC129806055 n=1 Tax=Phlebotomus papatasi TaxID=29031 RepID=UPI00248417DF|nr:uncharacterized protein LOC129806055 [Phlebotomus papatasi]